MVDRVVAAVRRKLPGGGWGGVLVLVVWAGDWGDDWVRLVDCRMNMIMYASLSPRPKPATEH